jgi:hypothetical protein
VGIAAWAPVTMDSANVPARFGLPPIAMNGHGWYRLDSASVRCNARTVAELPGRSTTTGDRHPPAEVHS